MTKTPRLAVLVLSALSIGLFIDGAIADSGSDGNIQNGKKVYNETCIACHGADGKGEVPGAPDLTKKKGRLTKSDQTLSDHVKNGFRSPGSPMAMPRKGGNPDLNDQDIKDVIQYMHEALHVGWHKN